MRQRIGVKMKSKLFYGKYEQSIIKKLFDQVNDNYNNFDKHIILVPERFALDTEGMLLDSLNVKSTFKCEVLSINRLCMLLGASQDLSKQEGILIIYRIILENDDRLKFFKLTDGRLGFAEEIYETIMQFKSCLVLPSEVDTNNQGILKAKLDDIKIIYEEYEKYLAVHTMQDGTAKINALVEKIKYSEFFENVAVYFIGFESMTALNMQVFNAFKMRGVPIFCGALYAQGGLNEHIYLNDLYTIYQNMLDGVDYLKVYVPTGLDSVFEHLLDNAFAYHPTRLSIDNEKIRLYQCKDILSEVRRLKKEIRTLTMSGVRYNEINVVLSNLDDYKDTIRKELIGMPYYMDDSMRLDNTEIARFILGLIELVGYGYSYDEWYKIVNNYYFEASQEQKLALNNYLHYYRPKGTKWLENFSDLLAFNKVLDVALRLKSCNTAQDFVLIIDYIIKLFDIESKTIELINNETDIFITKIHKKSLQVLCDMLKRIENICQDLTVSFIEFIRLIKNGLHDTKINFVPLSVDSLYIGDKSSFYIEKPYMFVLGAKNGDFPEQRSDCGILTDKDLDNISSKYKIEPKVSDLNMRSRLKVLQTITTPKRLVIMYPSMSGDSSNKQSPLMDSICDSFEVLGESLKIVRPDNVQFADKESVIGEHLDDVKGMVRAYLDDSDNTFDQDIKNAFAEVGMEHLLERHITLREDYFKNDTIQDKGYVSISEIKEYFDCPYKHFLNRSVRLKKVKPLAMSGIEVGNILHRVAELYCKNHNQFPDAILNKVLLEYKDVLAVTSPVVVSGLKKEAFRLMDAISDYMKNSLYKPTYFEYNFPRQKLMLETKYGNIQVKGKVDRIDVCNDRFILIDYKTGQVKFDSKGLFFGTKLQLPFYSYFVRKNLNKHLSGFGYFPIVDNFETQDSINYQVDGVYVNDDQVVSNIDLNFDFDNTYESQYFNIKHNVYKTTAPKYNSNSLSQEALDSLCDYAYKVSVKAVEEMIDGYIAISPNETERACEFCEFAGVCQKGADVKKVRSTRSVDLTKISDILKGGQDGVSTDE